MENDIRLWLSTPGQCGANSFVTNQSTNSLLQINSKQIGAESSLEQIRMSSGAIATAGQRLAYGLEVQKMSLRVLQPVKHDPSVPMTMNSQSQAWLAELRVVSKKSSATLSQNSQERIYRLRLYTDSSGKILGCGQDVANQVMVGTMAGFCMHNHNGRSAHQTSVVWPAIYVDQPTNKCQCAEGWVLRPTGYVVGADWNNPQTLALNPWNIEKTNVAYNTCVYLPNATPEQMNPFNNGSK
jgi:hypothetical protein